MEICKFIAFFKDRALAMADKISYPVIIKDSYGAVGDEVIKVNSYTTLIRSHKIYK